ncbi:unnamed protein product [Angiostrongylus costaricensis]|uniref:J domain-containing protein n=1 Tax=Angiostrongylus costaricensis TaxID=334426 RepID=A0A0R3PY39_ANGCS|nr:unnamed protein product [Angiostrongylus costaricensis]
MVFYYSSSQRLRSCGKIVSNCGRPQETNCWNCSDAVKCTKQFFCHTIQPPVEAQNLFEYIGIPVSFDIEESVLKKRFRELQSKLHPDKFVHASELEKEISDEHSRRLNESYKILLDPYLRAKYLLKILGNKEEYLDDDSLLKMMEWNEKVAVIEDEEELSEEKRKLQKEIDILLARLKELFAEKDIKEVCSAITRLSYLYSLRDIAGVNDRREWISIRKTEVN